jgi:hypothetical protein
MSEKRAAVGTTTCWSTFRLRSNQPTPNLLPASNLVVDELCWTNGRAIRFRHIEQR